MKCWKKNLKPSRGFKTVEEFEKKTKGIDELLIDGFENRIERKKNYDAQKADYSGKKHSHTDISLCISDKDTFIYYISKLYPGSNVDYAILKQEFPPEQPWFGTKTIKVDLGFIGIKKNYNAEKIIIGHKKPRASKNNPNPELTKEQKEWNKQVAKERIYVEHAIGGMKHFRILRNECRLKNINLKNKIVGLAAGLWNFRVRFRQQNDL